MADIPALPESLFAKEDYPQAPNGIAAKYKILAAEFVALANTVKALREHALGGAPDPELPIKDVQVFIGQSNQEGTAPEETTGPLASRAGYYAPRTRSFMYNRFTDTMEPYDWKLNDYSAFYVDAGGNGPFPGLAQPLPAGARWFTHAMTLPFSQYLETTYPADEHAALFGKYAFGGKTIDHWQKGLSVDAGGGGYEATLAVIIGLGNKVTQMGYTPRFTIIDRQGENGAANYQAKWKARRANLITDAQGYITASTRWIIPIVPGTGGNGPDQIALAAELPSVITAFSTEHYPTDPADQVHWQSAAVFRAGYTDLPNAIFGTSTPPVYAFPAPTTAAVLSFGELAPMEEGDAAVVLNATSTNYVREITYTSSDPAVATVGKNSGVWMLTPVGPGTATITANQAANGNFLAAAPVARTLTVEAGETGGGPIDPTQSLTTSFDDPTAWVLPPQGSISNGTLTVVNTPGPRVVYQPQNKMNKPWAPGTYILSMTINVGGGVQFTTDNGTIDEVFGETGPVTRTVTIPQDVDPGNPKFLIYGAAEITDGPYLIPA